MTDKANTYQEQSNVMKILPEIADSKKSSVLVIAHLRKPPVNKQNRIPTIDDISGSASFKQDATDVWIVHKQRKEDDETKSEYTNTGYLIVGKSKAGFTGPIGLVFGHMKAGMRELEQFE